MRLSNQDIQKYHRHRYPYLLVDCIEEINPGESAYGYKNFTEDEWIFHCNIYDDEPVPFTMIVEVLTEVFLLPILTLNDNAGKITNFISADNVEIFGDIHAGDRLDVKAEVKSWKRGVATGTVEGFVRGNVVVKASLKFVIPEIMESYRPKAILHQ